jgi:hypothetical protein
MSAKELSYAAHRRIIKWAVVKALAAKAEDSLRVLLETLDRILLGPQPPETLEGWARLAVREGARMAWSGLECRLPPDCPKGEAGQVYAVVHSASYTYTVAEKGARHGR